MQRTEEEWIRFCEELNAFWVHDGSPQRPHALLTKGGHSNGFFNAEVILENSIYLDQAAGNLLRLLSRENFNVRNLDRVLGPAMGAIKLAHDVARNISIMRDEVCLSSYAEKTSDGAMTFPRRSVRPDERVLLVEDVITTGGSVELTAEAVAEAGGITLPFVLALVNRSGLDEVFGKKIIALINKPMPVWTAETCPICTVGSPALRPKEGAKWARLTADY